MAFCCMICKLVSIIFYYIVKASCWVRVVLGTSCPGYELSWVRVVLGTSCLGYELSWVRVVLGTSCPGYELSWVRVVHNPWQSIRWYSVWVDFISIPSTDILQWKIYGSVYQLLQQRCTHFIVTIHSLVNGQGYEDLFPVIIYLVCISMVSWGPLHFVHELRRLQLV